MLLYKVKLYDSIIEKFAPLLEDPKVRKRVEFYYYIAKTYQYRDRPLAAIKVFLQGLRQSIREKNEAYTTQILLELANLIDETQKEREGNLHLLENAPAIVQSLYGIYRQYPDKPLYWLKIFILLPFEPGIRQTVHRVRHLNILTNQQILRLMVWYKKQFGLDRAQRYFQQKLQNRRKLYYKLWGIFLWENGSVREVKNHYQIAFKKTHDADFLLDLIIYLLKKEEKQEAERWISQFLAVNQQKEDREARFAYLVERLIEEGIFDLATHYIALGQAKGYDLREKKAYIDFLLKRYAAAISQYIDLFIEDRVGFYVLKKKFDHIAKQKGYSFLEKQLSHKLPSKSHPKPAAIVEKKILELKRYLVDVYLHTKDYKKALELSLEITLKTPVQAKEMVQWGHSNYYLDQLRKIVRREEHSSVDLDFAFVLYKKHFSTQWTLLDSIEIDYALKRHRLHRAKAILKPYIEKPRPPYFSTKKVWFYQGEIAMQEQRYKDALKFYLSSLPFGAEKAFWLSYLFENRALLWKLHRDLPYKKRAYYTALYYMLANDFIEADKHFRISLKQKSTSSEVGNRSLFFMYMITLLKMKSKKVAHRQKKVRFLVLLAKYDLLPIDRVIEEMQDFKERAGIPLLADFLTYQVAWYWIKNKRWEEARELLQKLKSEPPVPLLRQAVDFLLAVIQSKSRKEFLLKHPKTPYTFFVRELF